MAKLTAKQKRFIEEYLVDLNATQAAIRAGYSPLTASSIGDENLRKPAIAAAVQKAMAERSKRTGVNADRVIAELAKIGFANIIDVANFDDAMLLDETNRDDTAAIQSIKVKRIPTDDGYIIEREIRMCDKGRALEQLGRHLGIFNDRLKIDGGVSVIINDDLQN